MLTATRRPVIFLPHGGGPCFFMDGLGPPGTWTGMANWLKAFGDSISPRPRALVVVSAHWEGNKVMVLRSEKPSLLYDYYGFPPHTYELKYPALGSPVVAAEAMECLQSAGIEAEFEDQRGFDHGVFVPLKVAFPDAEIPIVQVSLLASLDPAEHLKIGSALAPLRDSDVLIVGSGMSYHNLRRFQSGGGREALMFDDWLNDTVTGVVDSDREQRMVNWSTATGARSCHPREEHLLPLMICAGAAKGEPGYRVYNESVLGSPISAFTFGEQFMPSV